MTRPVFVLGSPTAGNLELVAGLERSAIPAALVNPHRALARSEPGDIALARLDVLRTLDGVEPGLDLLPVLERHGVRLLNRREPLLATHDKLRSALLLEVAGIPQPHTVCLPNDGREAPLGFPLVVKPRFGSWGRDVFRCADRAELDRTLELVRSRTWFVSGLAIAQELIPPVGSDLRLLVAGGEIVGAGERVAAPGEWRTNVSLGGSVRAARREREAWELGQAAAAAIGTDLVGVDLMRHRDGWVVIELNGAVDFDQRYALPGRDVFRDAATALGLATAVFPGPMIGVTPDAETTPANDAEIGNLLAGGA